MIKLHNQELRILCWSRIVNRVMKKEMRAACFVNGDRVGAYRIRG